MTKIALPMLVAALLVAVTAACSQPASPAVTNTVPPGVQSAAPKTVEAARAVATEEAATYAAGDWGGTWDLWSAAGKKAISRADYAKLQSTCNPLTGVPLTVDNVRLEGDSSAVVRLSRMGVTFSYTEVYEGGQWRWQPSASDMADYALGVDALIAKKKAAGSCM